MRAGLALALALVLVGSSASAASVRNRYFPLDAETLAVGADGRVDRVSDAAQLVPGSRVLAGTPTTARELAAERAWLAAGTVPSVPELGDSTVVRDALLDLRTLGLPDGVPVAGWPPAWHYVWPRDSALAAVALARTGHLADAEAVLDFLQRVQPASGVFEARYLPDGSGVPDDRGPQLDGVGWALWALVGVTAEQPASQRAAFVARYRSLLDRSSAAALTSVATPDGLPRPSSDYWELPERQLTLATVALVRAGLQAAGTLYAEAGGATDQARAEQVRAAAVRLGERITAAFAADGYPRHRGGPASSTDLGAAFLLPPYAATADPGVLAAWRRAGDTMLRPAGGLAPGGSWPRDGVSWTTATSSYALTAAAVGDRRTAVAWLRWLDEHRTAAGSVPEKVLGDGRPASAAPLAWSAAVVVLTASTLSR